MIKTNKISDCVVFSKTKESFGGFSNMSPEFPITVGSLEFPTSEHFYQSMKYVDHPTVQREIFGEKNPMLMKNKQKKYKSLIRSDWEEVKGIIMESTIHLKLVCNWIKFGNLLLETGNKTIVELSKRDPYWGMILVKGSDTTLEGENQLGEILMNLRSKLWNNETRLELRSWNPEPNLRLSFGGWDLNTVKVDQRFLEVGERSFHYLMDKHLPPSSTLGLAA
jgi:ribA/ribD-fused uncharacterized protein